MKKEALTDRQREIYKFIKDFRKKNGHPPTYAEIGDAMNMTDSGASDAVRILADKGYIKRDRRPRMMKVL